MFLSGCSAAGAGVAIKTIESLLPHHTEKKQPSVNINIDLSTDNSVDNRNTKATSKPEASILQTEEHDCVEFVHGELVPCEEIK